MTKASVCTIGDEILIGQIIDTNSARISSALEAAGIKDVRAKSVGSDNAGNIAYATLEGLKNMMTVEKVAKLRGKSPEEILR